MKFKTAVIVISVFFFLSLLAMAITSGDFQYTKGNETVKEESMKICIIDSYAGLDAIRNICDLKQKDTKAFGDLCQELASNPDCECVKPVSPIRSSCISEVLNQTIFQGQTKGSTLLCLPRGTSLNWTLEWNITKEGYADFIWCKT